MVVADTNVISELFRLAPSVQVLDWFHSEPKHLLYTTAVTMAEVFACLESMPTGRRRTALTQVAENLFERDFAGRILGFDKAAAVCTPGFWRRSGQRAGDDQHGRDDRGHRSVQQGDARHPQHTRF